MGKLLKVKIKRMQGGGKTSYTYPTGYDAQKINVISYESTLTGGYDKVVNREDSKGEKNNHEFCIGIVDDANAAQFLGSKDIVEITKAEAGIYFGEDFDKKEEKVSDTNSVLVVLAKQARGEMLSENDLKVIDPNDVTSGIIKSKSFNEVLTQYGF